MRIVDIYRSRWLIEGYFKALKVHAGPQSALLPILSLPTLVGGKHVAAN